MVSAARQLPSRDGRARTGRGAAGPGRSRPAARTAALTGVVALAATALAGCASASSGPAHSARQERSYTRDIDRIDIVIGAGSLTLSPSKGHRVTISSHLEWSRIRPGVRQDWTGTVLRLGATCPDQGQCAVNYVITVPARTAVRARTSAGNVTISRLTGGATVTDTAGNVRLAGLGGAIQVTSQAGNVTGVRLRSGRVGVHGQSGNISLSFAAAPGAVTAMTQAGQVLIAVPPGGTAGYQVAAHTQAGQRAVRVHVSSRSRRVLVARTSAGNVTVR
jgi:hypothetical protein